MLQRALAPLLDAAACTTASALSSLLGAAPTLISSSASRTTPSPFALPPAGVQRRGSALPVAPFAAVRLRGSALPVAPVASAVRSEAADLADRAGLAEVSDTADLAEVNDLEARCGKGCTSALPGLPPLPALPLPLSLAPLLLATAPQCTVDGRAAFGSRMLLLMLLSSAPDMVLLSVPWCVEGWRLCLVATGAAYPMYGSPCCM